MQGSINIPEEDLMCESGAWSRPVGAPKPEQKKPLIQSEQKTSNDEKPSEKRGLILSFVILLLSIPALVGAWCWPALVLGLITGTVSAAARVTGHWISFSITLTMMLVIIAYTVYSLKNRSSKLGFLHKYGPLILTVCAVPLIMADLSRHVLQDTNIWKECEREAGQVWGPQCLWSSSQYRCNLEPPHCIPDREENMAHLSFIGILFTIVFTYTGFVLLIFGSLWNGNFFSKVRQIRSKWRQLRGVSNDV